MLHHSTLRECTASRVSDTARRPLHVPFPTGKRQDCQDSLVTVLSENVTTVSLSAAATVTCSEQLAHSRTAETIWRHIHLFPITNPSLDTD